MCAVECSKHSHEHCQACAKICEACADECKQAMVA
ncbi:four-helix bundle copper-binding protein [Niabella aquatica]